MPTRQNAVLSTLLATLTLATLFAFIGLGAATAGQLSGRWTITHLQGQPTKTPAGDITFDPADQSISGATACNFFRGGFERSGNTLSIKVRMMTRRGCIGDAAGHERAFLEAMEKTRAYRLGGNVLSLTGTDGTALAQLVSAPDAALKGPKHKIVSYLKDGGLHSVPAETGATITLKNGAIEGNTGCRPFTANYTRDGDRLKITGVTPAQTVKPCDEATRDQDAAILAALSKATTYDSSRNLIRLLEKADGNAVLWITPETP